LAQVDEIADLAIDEDLTFKSEMEKYKSKLKEIRATLQETMGGELSYCFLKAP
jgi:hypothetical protein